MDFTFSNKKSLLRTVDDNFGTKRRGITSEHIITQEVLVSNCITRTKGCADKLGFDHWLYQQQGRSAQCWGRLNWRVGRCLSDLHNGSLSVGAPLIIGRSQNCQFLNYFAPQNLLQESIREKDIISAMEETTLCNKHSYIHWHTAACWLFSSGTPALGVIIWQSDTNRSFYWIDWVRPT